MVSFSFSGLSARGIDGTDLSMEVVVVACVIGGVACDGGRDSTWAADTVGEFFKPGEAGLATRGRLFSGLGPGSIVLFVP